MMKNKKILITLVVFITLILGLNGCGSDSPKIELKSDDITVEYGDDTGDALEKNILNEDSKEIEYKCDDIDSFDNEVAVGKYTVTYQYENTTKKITLHVKDTTAPVIKQTKEISTLENTNVDLQSYISVEELSKYEIKVDDSGIVYAMPGNYPVKYTVTDKYKNVSNLETTITIEEVTLQTSTPAISLNPEGTSKFEISTNSSDLVTYTSSNENVASVDNYGNITAKNAGRAVIKAAVNGKEVSTTVTVNKPKPAANTNRSISNQESNNDNVSYTVYRTKTGDCYHSANCRYLSRSKIAISLSSAKSSGLRPCSVCNP